MRCKSKPMGGRSNILSVNSAFNGDARDEASETPVALLPHSNHPVLVVARW